MAVGNALPVCSIIPIKENDKNLTHIWTSRKKNEQKKPTIFTPLVDSRFLSATNGYLNKIYCAPVHVSVS